MSKQAAVSPFTLSVRVESAGTVSTRARVRSNHSHREESDLATVEGERDSSRERRMLSVRDGES